MKDPEGRAKEQGVPMTQLSPGGGAGPPAIVHDRDAHQDCLDIARAHPNARGVFHCYAGSVGGGQDPGPDGVDALPSLGTSPLKRPGALEVLEWLPLEHIMLETDAPYDAGVPFRGRRCDSGYLYRMAETVAQIKGLRHRGRSGPASRRKTEDAFPPRGIRGTRRRPQGPDRKGVNLYDDHIL